jgi:S1-C subfamily serine protease
VDNQTWAALWTASGAAIGFVAARTRRFNGVGGVLSGALLGPGLACLLFLVRGGTVSKCPQCGEWASVRRVRCPNPNCSYDFAADLADGTPRTTVAPRLESEERLLPRLGPPENRSPARAPVEREGVGDIHIQPRGFPTRKVLLWLAPTVALATTVLWFLALSGYSSERIAAAALRSTVAIEVRDNAGTSIGIGSGFFVAPNVVATCLHVIEGAWDGTVTLSSGRSNFHIRGLVGIDRRHDLALIEVDGSAADLELATALPAIGEQVYAAGTPQGLAGTFTQGIINATRSWRGEQLLQMSAPVSKGSSGGPVLNRYGQVVGVTTMMMEGGQNLNFAVPAGYLATALRRRSRAVPLINAVLGGQRDRERSELSGLVHVVVTEEDGRVVGRDTYDVFGNLLSSEKPRLTESSSPASVDWTTFSYDDQHRIVERTEGAAYSDGVRFTSQRCSYSRSIQADGLVKMVAECRWETNNELWAVDVVLLDADDRPTHERSYHSGGKGADVYPNSSLRLSREIRYGYDARGCRIWEADDSGRREQKCDGQNRLTEFTWPTTTTTKGFWLKLEYSPTGYVARDSDGGVFTCLQEQDSQGNWLMRSCADSSDSAKKRVERRVITYY